MLSPQGAIHELLWQDIRCSGNEKPLHFCTGLTICGREKRKRCLPFTSANVLLLELSARSLVVCVRRSVMCQIGNAHVCILVPSAAGYSTCFDWSNLNYHCLLLFERKLQLFPIFEWDGIGISLRGDTKIGF